MLNITRKLVENATILPTTTDRYGDPDYGTGMAVKCLYRDISTLSQANYQEAVAINGVFWFPSGTVVSKGDVISYSGEFYTVVKIIRAKRLVLNNALAFIKCEVNRQRQIS
jgi:hypothetical protein